MEVTIIKMFDDNYAYLVKDTQSNEAAIIDVGEFSPCSKEVSSQNVALKYLLCTHHHDDHIGGVTEMNTKYGGTIVSGDDRVPGVEKKIEHGDIIKMGAVKIEAIATPCHTTSHISYHCTAPNSEPAVFTGDILFVGGCGRFFEGSARDMVVSADRLSKLADNTRVYCGHNYTLSNMKFAASVEPENKDVTDKLQWSIEMKKDGNKDTVPSSIGDEKKFNPFMRYKVKSVGDNARKQGSQYIPVSGDYDEVPLPFFLHFTYTF
eukprot:TRINITY_DN25873_c0_g1_i1.p1 TRINITY_DN25873_c0_g1~~TRINITY_DN25873_c0_g1_i1.p1  ORF type:complete len:263 (-),score=53.35 TRINITY_DN25873_c0_g1_i1:8-796(-)